MILLTNQQLGIKDFNMKNPSFLKISCYIFLKYLAFSVFMMFKNKVYYLVNPGIRNGGDLFYYLWTFFSLPLSVILIFSFPLYYAFRTKNKLLFLTLIGIFILGEYFLYTYLASPSDLTNGVYNGLLSCMFLVLFFPNHFKSRSSKN